MSNKCIICGSDKLNSFAVKEMMFGSAVSFDYNYCSGCDSILKQDLFADLKDEYPQDYYSFRDTRNNLTERLRFQLYVFSVKGTLGRLWFANNFAASLFDEKSAYAVKGLIEGSRNILDVGCGSGALIRSFSTIFKNKNFTGIDPYIEKSIKLSNNCVLLKEDLLLHQNSYDLILMNHSFEHMNNPAEIIQRLSMLLNPGGFLIIRIPVCDSLFFHRYGVNWVQLDAPRHKIIYSNNSLGLCLRKFGFEIIHSYSDSKVFSYLASEMYREGISLVNTRSYFKNRIRQFFRRDYFEKSRNGRRIVDRLNEFNYGDQRAFIIAKK